MSSFYSYVHKNYILAVIECASYNKSHKLKLADFDLVEFPPSIMQCQELRRLYLQHNQLTNLPEDIIKQLVNLKFLAIDFNKIQSLPVTLWNLQNLTEINLSYNPIKTIPKEIKLLVNLELLWINSCELSELPDEICELESLDTLGARNNAITELPRDFYKLNIRWLTLTGNKLSHLPENFNLPNLMHLNLSNNCFNKIPFEISQPKTLSYCVLKENSISHVTKTEIAHMKHIFKIDLRDNPLQCYGKLIAYKNLALSNLEFANSESDSDTSEDWEESLNSSEIDLSNSDSEHAENENIPLELDTFKFLIS